MTVAAPEEAPVSSGASSSSSSPAIRVIDKFLVPPHESSSPGPDETSLPLTFFDLFWLHSPPVERLLVYRLAPDGDVDAVLTNLRTSLSEALRAFYPLAGRVRPTPGTADRHELHYRPGDTVAFTVAESSEHDVDGLATDDPREVARIAPLLPPLPEEGAALLAVQATVLPSGGRSKSQGLALGVTVHHAACDGSGSTHFLHTWAALCNGGAAPPPDPPVINRSVVPDPGGLYDVFYRARPTKDEMEFVKMAPDQLLATFVLSADDLRRVKDAVASEAAARAVAPPPRCSSLVATLGLVWSCYHRAKKPANGHHDSESGPTCLLFAVDHRSRTNPPVPEKYLGNCVGPAFAIASKADLTAEPPSAGLFAACAAVAAAIREAVGETGGTPPAVEAWMDRVREVGTMGPLSVAGSPRFRVYDLDFGFGAPAKVDIVSVARTGAVAVAESGRHRDGSGTGGSGMEVGVSLRPDGMRRFRDCFADAVAWLRAGATGDE